MTARTVATDTRSVRYVLAEYSEVVAVITFAIILGTMLAYRGIARFIGGGDFAYLDSDVKPVLFNILNGPLTWLNTLSTPAANFRFSTVWFVGLVIIATVVGEEI